LAEFSIFSPALISPRLACFVRALPERPCLREESREEDAVCACADVSPLKMLKINAARRYCTIYVAVKSNRYL
jgi:hypothetical protein